MKHMRGTISRAVRPPESASAWSRTDLLAVVVTIMLLASVTVRGFILGQFSPRAALCMEHHRRLTAAWKRFADDHEGRMPMVLVGDESTTGTAISKGREPWALGWMDWTSRGDNTNVLFLLNPNFGVLGPYLEGDASVFRCPADTYLSPSQVSRGWTRRVRSVSGNVGIGAGNAEGGPWDSIYRHITKESEFMNPSPAETFVYLDEHPDSINDPGYYPPHKTGWIDIPATYHQGGGTFGFADGHAEVHTWSGSMASMRSVMFRTFGPSPAPVGDPDLHWVSYHTQRVSENSY